MSSEEPPKSSLAREEAPEESSRAPEQQAPPPSGREEAPEESPRAPDDVDQRGQWVALSSIPAIVLPKAERAELLTPDAVDLLLDLTAPPRPSYLVVPDRLAPVARLPGRNTFPYVVAACSSRVLLYLLQPTGTGPYFDGVYFLCDAHARTASRVPRVPADLGVTLIPRRSVGLIADPRDPDHYIIAQLHPISTTRHTHLLCYSTATGEWALKPLASAPDHLPWGANGVFPHAGRLYCWVDIAYGVLVCDPFHDTPHLAFVPLPAGCQLLELRSRIRFARLLDDRRCIRPSQGKLRYVEILGFSYDDDAVSTAPPPPDNPAVRVWTLTDPDGPDHWTLECVASFADIWDHYTYIATGLPREVPVLALIDPTNCHVVYFFLGTSLFGVDVRHIRVVACEECFVDYELHELRFQYSRFIDAWELPPGLRLLTKDPSSDGGSGTTGSDGEDFNVNELTSLLRQMEIKSQPDREHSVDEMLRSLVHDLVQAVAAAPSDEPSLDAGDQAHEP